MKSDHNADEGLEMAFDDTVAVAQVRAYKDKIETDKIGCTVFLSDWLKLMPDKDGQRLASTGGRRTGRGGS